MVELYLSCDPVADALYVRVPGGEIVDRVEVAEDVIVDYNSGGR